MGSIEKRITELEQRTTATTGQDERPPYTMTPDDALAVFDILAACGVVEDVMRGVPPSQLELSIDELAI